MLVPLDAIAVVAGLVGAYTIRSQTHELFGVVLYDGTLPPFQDFFQFVLFCAVWLIVIFSLHGLYATTHQRRFLSEIPHVVYASLIWILGIITWFFIQRELFFSRFVLLAGSILTVVCIIILRAATRLLRRSLLSLGIGNRRIVMIGDTPLTYQLFNALAADRACTFVGLLSDTALPHTTVSPLPRLGGTDETEAIITKKRVTEVIVVSEHLTEKRIEELSYFCQEHQVELFFVPQLYGLNRSQFVAMSVLGVPLIQLRRTSLEGWGRVWKRTFDILFSSMGIIVFSIPAIIIGIAIKLDSPGSVLVALPRIRHGSVFSMYKFRSMVSGAHRLKQELLTQNERSGPLFKMKNDPRVTRIGRILRRTHIDEIPQLLNVLRGEMSVVGPRPHEPEEVSRYEKRHRIVLSIKPGMTGLAQVSGASDLDFEEEVRLDKYYIEQWSPLLDASIIFRTIGTVFSGKGGV